MSDRYANVEPQTRRFLETLAAQKGPPLSALSIAGARASEVKMQAFDVAKMPADIENRRIAAGPTGQIAIRIVRPKRGASLVPVVMYFHGGGWVLGDKDTYDRTVREIANGADAAVVVVDFDRAPETKYPTAIEQAYAATKYVAEHASGWNLDGSRIAVVGDSAGGNMATVVSMMARDRGGPDIALQVLFYPTTDANFDTPSYREFSEGYFLGREDMKWFWDQYLPDKAARREPTASPLQASVEQLRELPPAVIFTGEFDPLRDEIEAYAHKLTQAGVTVTAVRVLGAIHGLVTLNPLANTPAARATMALACDRLRNALSRSEERRTHDSAA